MTDPNTAAAAPAATDEATAAVDKAVASTEAAAQAEVTVLSKDAETLITEGADHIKQFVEKNLPTLEAQGHDFAGSLGTKLKGWLGDVEAFFAAKTASAPAPAVPQGSVAGIPGK